MPQAENAPAQQNGGVSHDDPQLKINQISMIWNLNRTIQPIPDLTLARLPERRNAAPIDHIRTKLSERAIIKITIILWL
jgi:hypothetical protein